MALLSVQSLLPNHNHSRLWCNPRLWQQRPDQWGWKAQVWAGVRSLQGFCPGSSLWPPLGEFWWQLHLWSGPWDCGSGLSCHYFYSEETISLSETLVSLGKPVPLSETDLITLCRGWSWGKIHSFSCQTCLTCQPTVSPCTSWAFSVWVSQHHGDNQPKRYLVGLGLNVSVSHFWAWCHPALGIIKICSFSGTSSCSGWLTVAAGRTFVYNITASSHWHPDSHKPLHRWPNFWSK